MTYRVETYRSLNCGHRTLQHSSSRKTSRHFHRCRFWHRCVMRIDLWHLRRQGLACHVRLLGYSCHRTRRIVHPRKVRCCEVRVVWYVVCWCRTLYSSCLSLRDFRLPLCENFIHLHHPFWWCTGKGVLYRTVPESDKVVVLIVR
jgi:hypothetical protein